MSTTTTTTTEPVKIEFTEVTTGDIEGNGVFDQLMRISKLHIKEEYESQRITGGEYAELYLGIMQVNIQQSIDFVLRRRLIEAETKNAEKDFETKEANTKNIEEQTALYKRQREGFDDNKYQKLFETQMNAWSLMFSSGLLADKPSIISDDSASSLYNKLKPQ